MIPFTKGHGLGNDYLVIDEADLPCPLSKVAIVRTCDRNWGIGSDGILLSVPTTKADFGLRIFNPDGSEAEKSGNGLRIFAKYLWDHGRATKTTFTVETKGGVVECRCHLRDERVVAVTVEMGRATFRAREVPMDVRAAAHSMGEASLREDGLDGDAVGVDLVLPDRTSFKVTAVSVGNPHCVIFVDRLDESACKRLGPLIETHPAFPNRTNVQFVHVRSRRDIEISIWERGAGYTLASGSSSCAAASASVRNGLCDHGKVTVNMPGGELVVDVRPDWSLRLEGPVEEVCSGTLAPEFEDTYIVSTAS